MAAKKGKRKYDPASQNEVKKEMRKMKKGTAKSGRGGKTKVKSKKQAIAIALSKARKKGAKVPAKKTGAKRATKKRGTKKKAKK